MRRRARRLGSWRALDPGCNWRIPVVLDAQHPHEKAGQRRPERGAHAIEAAARGRYDDRGPAEGGYRIQTAGEYGGTRRIKTSRIVPPPPAAVMTPGTTACAAPRPCSREMPAPVTQNRLSPAASASSMGRATRRRGPLRKNASSYPKTAQRDSRGDQQQSHLTNLTLCRSKIGFWLWPGPFRFSGGSLVFVDQTAEDRFSADLARAEVWCSDAGPASVSGDALVDALVRPGGGVMILVVGQVGAQVRLVQDQGRAGELTAQSAIRRSQIAFIRGACKAVRTMVVPAAWKTASKDAVKFEPRSRIRKRKPANRSPRTGGQVAGLLHRPVTRRVGGDAAELHPAGAVLDEHQHVQPGQRHRVPMQEVGGLRLQEPPPGPAVPARRRVNAHGAQDFIDRRS